MYKQHMFVMKLQIIMKKVKMVDVIFCDFLFCFFIKVDQTVKFMDHCKNIIQYFDLSSHDF